MHTQPHIEIQMQFNHWTTKFKEKISNINWYICTWNVNGACEKLQQVFHSTLDRGIVTK
jgi:hypothetical protein